MKRFDEFKIGESFHSTCSISENELETYLNFSRIKNTFLDNHVDGRIVPGRAILARIEGEFTRLSQIYGNQIVLVGVDGDQAWSNRSVRFLNPLYTDEVLKIKFTVSDKINVDDTFGNIVLDYEGTRDDTTIVISRKNIYRLKR